jgi:hypothetical protein
VAVANFEELCKGIAAIEGLKPPVLTPGESGTWAFTVHMRGVDVTVLQFSERCLETAFLVAEFGAIPSDVAEQGWLALMHTNLLMAAENAPVFSRNPRNGDVLLQCACPLEEVTVTDVYQRISDMVDLAVQWRQDMLFGEPRSLTWPRSTSNFQSLPPKPPYAASKAFGALYLDVCEALEHPQTELPMDEGVRGFPLKVGGANVFVLHLSCRIPDCIFALVTLGGRSLAPKLTDLLSLMEANFTLLSQQRSTVFGRDAVSGKLFLQCAYPLAGLTARRLLDQVEALTRLAPMRDWLPAGDSGSLASADAPM